jgi:hypothetical protein
MGAQRRASSAAHIRALARETPLQMSPELIPSLKE